jgi:hypothetical protein
MSTRVPEARDRTDHRVRGDVFEANLLEQRQRMPGWHGEQQPIGVEGEAARARQLGRAFDECNVARPRPQKEFGILDRGARNREVHRRVRVRELRDDLRHRRFADGTRARDGDAFFFGVARLAQAHVEVVEPPEDVAGVYVENPAEIGRGKLAISPFEERATRV